MKTYQKITSLARQMQDTPQLTARRSAAKQLYEALSQPGTRLQLAVEAPTLQALRAVWEIVVSSAIASAQKIDARAKQGLTVEDIEITFALIQLADTRYSDEVYMTAASTPPLPPEFARYRNSFLLGSKQVRKVLNFCFELLDDERACEKAEQQILRMVAGMVGQTGYVSSFRSEAEIQVILEEVERRIIVSSSSPSTDKEEEVVPYLIQVSAAEIFRNLMRTATIELGMDLPVLVASSIKMVAAWCTRAVNEVDMRLSTQNIFLPLLDGIACLMRINPEQACEPIRRHGRVILKFSKKTYRQTNDRHHREIFHDYCSAHLLTLQVAGQLQGRLPGDLGDLGQGSLSLRWFEDTIDMLIQRYSDVSDETGFVETQLGNSHTKQLTLIAHLLACAQRIYLCDAELETDALSGILGKVAQAEMTNPSAVVGQKKYDHHLPEVEPSIILESPFWKHVLLPLLCSSSKHPLSLLENTDQTTRHGRLLAAANADIQKRKPPATTKIRQLLQIVSVCASLYPAGGCWMTNSFACWYELPTLQGDEDFVDAQAILPCRYIQGSSPKDLGILLNVIGNLLELQGEINGDSTIQLWATRTLERLTRSTSYLALLRLESTMNDIVTAWRGIWSIIFRKDLRYVSSTKDCSPGGNGHALSSLIAAIAKNSCLDIQVRWSHDIQARHSTFLHQHQSDVWNLPLFSNEYEMNRCVASRLVVSLVHSVGLAESEDSIVNFQYENAFNFTKNGGRRGRLVNFFLADLCRELKGDIIMTTQSLALLVHGKIHGSQHSSSPSVESPDILNEGRHQSRTVVSNFGGQWEDLPLTNAKVDFCFPSVLPSMMLAACHASLEKCLPSADLLSESAVRQLSDSVNDAFDRLFQSNTQESDQSEGLRLHERIHATLAKLCYLNASPKAAVEKNFANLCGDTSILMSDMKSCFLSAISPLSTIIANLTFVIKGLLLLGAINDLELPNSIVIAGDDVYKELVGVLNTCSSNGSPSKPELGSTVAFDSDDESRGETDFDHDTKRNCQRPGEFTPKRQRTTSHLSSVDVCICADMVIALRPTSSTFKTVMKGLMGVGFDRRGLINREQVVQCDPAAVVFVVWLACSHYFRQSHERSDSVMGTVIQILKIFKASDAAKWDSGVYAFYACLEMLRRRIVSDDALTSDECADVVSLWSEIDQAERKKSNLRYCNRVQSIESASSTFLLAGSDLRLHWGTEFPRLVLPGVCDSHGSVRRQASYSISKCLKSTANELPVIESTMRNIYTIADGREKYRKWFTSFCPKLDINLEQMWEDLLPSVVCSSLLNVALIGGRTSLTADQTKLVFRILDIASQYPEYEGTCFLALEKMASLAGYSCLEALAAELCNDILWIWCTQKPTRSLTKRLPLLLVSPGTIRFKLKTGLHRRYGKTEMEHLRSEVSTDFALRSQLIFPMLLSTVTGPIQADERINDFLSLYEQGGNAIEKITRQFLPGAWALYLCLKWGTEEDQTRSSALRSRLSDIIPMDKLTKGTRRSLNIIMCEVLSWLGSSFALNDVSSSDMKDDIVEFLKEALAVEHFDSLHDIGVSVCSLFLFAALKLGRNQNNSRAAASMRSFEVVALMMLTSSDATSERHTPSGFLLFLVSRIMTERHTGDVIRRLLRVSKDILTNLLSGFGHRVVDAMLQETKNDIRILFVSVLSIHEQSQTKLLELLRTRFARFRQAALMSMGIDSHVGEDGGISESTVSRNLFSSELEYFRRIIGQEECFTDLRILSTLEVAHEFISHAVVVSPVSVLRYHELLSVEADKNMDSADVSLLGKLNKNFCLPDIRSRDSETVSTSSPRIILSEISLLMESMTDAFASYEGHHPMSPSNKLLEIQLKRLAAALSRGHVLSANEFIPTVQMLARLCQEYPKGIAHASIKCLGMMRPTIERGISVDALESRSNKFDIVDTLESTVLALESGCVKVLVRSLRSSDMEKAILSCETLESVLQRRKPAEFSRYLDQNLSRFLDPFFSQFGKLSNKHLVLDRTAIDRLKQDMGGGKTWEDWCWDETFWKKAVTMSFDSWICLIVPAILACTSTRDSASRNNEPIERNDSKRFLESCQAMTRIDPAFAAAVFPLCILGCLRDTNMDSTDENSVEFDTWIGSSDAKQNKFISLCFSSLISTFLDSDLTTCRAASLVLDTLDLLRILTQTRFLQSRNHISNNHVKKSSQSTSSQGSSSSIVPDGQSNFMWKGVIYGVVVRLDGLLIARACSQLGRHASARFYAEAYAENRFGGSTRSMPIISSGFCLLLSPRTDVSGFCNSDASQSSDDNSLVEDATQFLQVLLKCSISDKQVAEKSALETLISDLSLLRSTSARSMYRVSSHSPVDEIRRLNYEEPSLHQTSSIVNSLADLGMPFVLHSFVAGQSLLNGTKSVPASISAHWFQSCLEDPRYFDVDFSRGNDACTNYERLSRLFSFNGSTFFESFLSGLASYARNDTMTCRVRILASKERMVHDLPSVGTGECSLRDVLGSIDKAAALHETESLTFWNDHEEIFHSWIDEHSNISRPPAPHDVTIPDAFPLCDFTREVALRMACYRSVSDSVDRSRKLTSTLRQLMWQIADRNYKLGEIGKCEALHSRLRTPTLFSDHSREDNVRLAILEANIHEARGNKLLAVQSMKQIVQWLQNYRSSDHDDIVLAESFLDLGKRLSNHNAETGELILTQYFEPGLLMARKYDSRVKTPRSRRILCSGYFSHADLLINLHQIVSTRISSPEWITAGRSLAEREKELRECELLIGGSTGAKKKPSKSNGVDRDLSIYRLTLSREVHNAKEARLRIENSVDDFLLRSAQSIVSALTIAGCEERGVSKYVYRLVSIWFESRSTHTATKLQELFTLAVERIPTYRFVPLINQLFARLGSQREFAANLKALSQRMCSDHPYHCLVHMVRLLGDGSHTDDVQRGREKVAREILTVVQNEKTLCPLVEAYEALCSAYISLASVDANSLKLDKKKKCRLSSLPTAARLDIYLGRRKKDIESPPGVFTNPPSIRPGCDYQDVETISSFNDTFSITDAGLARPKIIICNGSKGGSFRQLVKGGDDCRGDSVMEQVFLYANELFRTSKFSTTDQTKIITYNVIPLSAKTGVIEWVENTTPLVDYISDSKTDGCAGLHSRMFPGEWGFRYCRDYLDKAKREEKRKAFDEICRHHSPVFRFFFVELFGRCPQSWYVAKKKYSRSVAVSSFVGHILGIGDRHGSNILIHKGTGEVVHIDFGIVFEQGKVLNIPEKVPFRLTQNIVDGLGPTGPEGLFSSAAESTLTVLRGNADSLLTILAAVVNDPLYKWSVSPLQARRRQRMAALSEARPKGDAEMDRNERLLLDNQNEVAKHAIQRVREKLNGYEDGTSGEQQSVEGQVRFLIRSARDPDDLSEMFPGWAPWM